MVVRPKPLKDSVEGFLVFAILKRRISLGRAGFLFLLLFHFLLRLHFLLCLRFLLLLCLCLLLLLLFFLLLGDLEADLGLLVENAAVLFLLLLHL
jgi:hypothetical protein